MCTIRKSLRFLLGAARDGSAFRRRSLFRILRMKEMRGELAYWKARAQQLEAEKEKPTSG